MSWKLKRRLCKLILIRNFEKWFKSRKKIFSWLASHFIKNKNRIWFEANLEDALSKGLNWIFKPEFLFWSDVF